MKTVQLSDEAYEALKGFIVDPFDDSPEKVIVRLMDIVNKARERWKPFDPIAKGTPAQPRSGTLPNGTRIPEQSNDEMTVML
jgi:hypothetical protein